MTESHDGMGGSVAERLRAAEAARAAGDVAARRAHLVEPFHVARASGNTAVMTTIALALPPRHTSAVSLGVGMCRQQGF